MLKITYTHARANLAGFCNEVTRNREIVIIDRRKGENVAMIAADELESLVETAYLLRSPRNTRRILSALDRAMKRKGHSSSPNNLRKEMGLAK